MSGPLVRRLVREERGAFLVEIMVSAMLLIMLTGGVMLSFDAASKRSGEQRAQAVAANLAQSEIDRVRSLKFTQIAVLNTTRPTIDVDGTKFTVNSRSEAALAPNAAGSGCNTSARSPEALKITATVSWTGMGNRRPVAVSSLVAAPSEGDASRGSFVVQIVNKLGYGVEDVSVNLVGASNVTGATDANGCVRFTDLLPQTGYRLMFSRTGWFTTPDFRTAVDDPVDVVAATTGTKTYQYDPGGKLTAQFFFKRFRGKDTSSSVDATEYSSAQKAVTWEHASLSAPLVKSVSPAASQIQSDSLYPEQSSPYGVYADACTASRPTAPETMQPTAVKRVQLPSLDVVVQNLPAGSYLYGVTGCADWANSASMFASAIGPRTFEADPRRNTGGASGWSRLADGGWPWGSNNFICIRNKTSRKFRYYGPFDNKATNGAKSTIIDFKDFTSPPAGTVGTPGTDTSSSQLCGQNVGFDIEATMP